MKKTAMAAMAMAIVGVFLGLTLISATGFACQTPDCNQNQGQNQGQGQSQNQGQAQGQGQSQGQNQTAVSQSTATSQSQATGGQAVATGGSTELSGQFGGTGGTGGAGGSANSTSSSSANNSLQNVGNASVRIEDKREFLPVPAIMPLPVVKIPKYNPEEDVTNYEFIPFVLMSYGGSLKQGLLADKEMAEAMVKGDSDSFWVGTDNYDMDGKFLDRTGDRYQSVRVQYIPGIDLLYQISIADYGKPKGAVEISAEPGKEVTTKYLLGHLILEALDAGVTNLIVYEDGSRTENWEKAKGLGVPGGASTISGSTGIAGGGVIGYRSNTSGFHRDITIRALGLEGNVQKVLPSSTWDEEEER